jgi:hypothetical protein
MGDEKEETVTSAPAEEAKAPETPAPVKEGDPQPEEKREDPASA